MAPEATQPTGSGHRIQALDLVKGLAILVVIHTHTVFWSGMGYLPDWSRNASLVFDVPVFFFISGFLLASGRREGLPLRALRQARSILGPYLSVGAVALMVSTAAKVAAHGSSGLDGFWRSVWTMFRLAPDGPGWELWAVFPGSLWFFRSYLEVLPLAVLVLVSPLRARLGVVFLAAIAVLSVVGPGFQPDPGGVKTDSLAVTLGALLLVVAGSWFQGRWWPAWTLRHSAILATVWVASLACLVLWIPPAKALDLTYGKFPPTWSYLLVNLLPVQVAIALATWERARGSLPGPAGWSGFLGWCGRNSFEIFLVQGLATSIPLRVVDPLLHRGLGPAAVYSAVLAWNLGSTLGGAWILVAARQALKARFSP